MNEKAFLDEAESVARAGLKAMKDYLAYQGSNKDYHARAKVGSTAVASYTRHFASLTNRAALDFAIERAEEPTKRLRG